MSGKVQGLADAFALFGALPDAARDELGVDLAILGRDYLALQQVRAPKDTGELESELGVQLLLDQLRVRIGLVGKQSLAKFYGRVIEFGRTAQAVLAHRRTRSAPRRLWNGRQRVESLQDSWIVHVRARAPAPFINLPDADLDAIAAQRLADFWGRTLSRAGA